MEHAIDYTEHLARFLEAQDQTYQQALAEVKHGRKQTHWMWFIFPQLKNLGKSTTAAYYGIDNLDMATAYLRHPILGQRLVAISTALKEVNGKTAHDIFGLPDDFKLRSSMTLFSLVKGADPIFGEILGKYFNGQADPLTMELLMPVR